MTWTDVEHYAPQSWLCLYPPCIIHDASTATLANALGQDMGLHDIVVTASADLIVLDDMADGHKSNV